MAMVNKPFQNEELHHCLELVPGQRYRMEIKANTSAPYGDKFDLFIRCGKSRASERRLDASRDTVQSLLSKT